MSSIESMIAREIAESITVKQRLLDDSALLAQIHRVCELLRAAYGRGNKVLLAGNGGSAADAQHIAAELVVRYQAQRPALPALALTTDTSILTAASNDYGYEQVFCRQLNAHARPGDVFIALSTSGQSPNILAALQTGAALGVTRIGLTGANGAEMLACCEECIQVPTRVTARAQEAHILLGHIFCHTIEQGMLA